jgi:hypothetical protein
LSHIFDGPLRYGESIRFETIPSTETAGMFEHGRAVVRQMLVVCDRDTAAGQPLRQTLLALFERLVSQIVALQFDQVERDQDGVMIAADAAATPSRSS